MLAFGTSLLGFQHTSAGLLHPPDSAMDNLPLCTSTCPEHRLSTAFFFSYAHKVIQTHPLSNLSIGTLWYKCTGEIFLEERSFIVGNSQLKKAARSQGRPLIPCKEALIPVLSQHLLIHCQTQFGVNKATHTHMLKIFCRA